MILFFTTLVSVFLLGFQQKNVAGDHYGLAAITSCAIAFTQFSVYRAAVAGSSYDWVLMGAGGAIGITTSMFVHKKLTRKNKWNGIAG